MYHIDLLELGVGQKALDFLAIVLNKASDIPLNRAARHLFNECLAEVLEEKVKGLVEPKSLFDGDLMYNSFALSIEILVSFEILKLFLTQELWRANTSQFLFLYLLETGWLMLVPSWVNLALRSKDVIDTLRDTRALTHYLLLDRIKSRLILLLLLLYYL
jgi:hypothetical protein